MLVICYGIAKSGSTLAFELVRGILTSVGYDQQRVRSFAVKKRSRANYLAMVTRESIADLVEVVGPDRIVAAKTHMEFSDEMFGWLDELQTQRKLQIVASYRDPRDVCLSLLDAGAEARETGKSGFGNIEDLARAAKLVDKSIHQFRKWASLKGALRVYYPTVAFAPDEAIDSLERVLGVTSDRAEVKRHAYEDAFTQKNKAKKSRYEDEMSEAQKAEMTRRFGTFIERVCEQNDETWFTGFRDQMLARGAAGLEQTSMAGR